MTLMHSLVRKNRLWKSSVVCVMRYDVKCHAYMAHTSLDYSRNSKKKTPLYIVERRFFWWEQRESNPRPSACKADALNQLSYAPVSFLFADYCVRLRIFSRSLPQGNSLLQSLSSLFSTKINFNFLATYLVLKQDKRRNIPKNFSCGADGTRTRDPRRDRPVF